MEDIKLNDSFTNSAIKLNESLTRLNKDDHDASKYNFEKLEKEFKLKEEEWQKESLANDSMLQKKNEQIDTMRVKLNRYEFAIKEALLFLAKPMESYTAWLQNDPSKSINFRDRNPSEPKKLVAVASPQQAAQSQQTKITILTENIEVKPLEELGSPAATYEVSSDISADQISSLECIRLALNYLKSAQSSVQNMGTFKANSAAPKVEDFSNPEKKLDSDYLKDFGKEQENKILSDPISNTTEIVLQEFAERQLIQTQKQIESLARSIKQEEKKSNTVFLEEVGDLALGVQRESLNLPPMKKNETCQNCREYMLRVDHLQDQVDYLKRDVTALVSQLNEERSCRQRVQLSKDILDQELEELTVQLFDQANRMVIDESKLREQFENNNYVLQGELKDLSKKFGNREQELNDLRRCLVALDEAKQRAASGINDSPRSSLTSLSVSPIKSTTLQAAEYFYKSSGNFFSSRIGPQKELLPFIPVDGVLLMEFQEHIKVAMTCQKMTLENQLKLLMETTFVKRSLLEVIEPCLFYSYQHNFTNLKASTVSSSFKKKLLDSVIRSLVEIKLYWSSKEDLYLNNYDVTDEARLSNAPDSAVSTASNTSTSATSTPLSQFSSKNPPPLQTNQNENGPPKKKCSNCCMLKECDYRMRFKQPENPKSKVSEWFQMCRFCRDRVASSCDFFTFIINIANLKGVTLLGMFRHMLWLKRKVVVSIVGSCSLFEGEVVSSFKNGEVNSSGWEKLVEVIG
ncbi:hypothetical protein HDU92_005142 [Lobulomyces angularis]|nr:hypothetical protein HDU92_005142 [Lobulomyces angularis]